MPYQERSDLPDFVQDDLPPHGQEIYKEAFNRAWDEYEDVEERKDDETREEVSHKVAWAAVKQQYRQRDDGKWVKKQA